MLPLISMILHPANSALTARHPADHTGPSSMTQQPADPAAPADLVVSMVQQALAVCTECGTLMPKGHLLFRENECVLCLACADLDHLELLPSGDAAMSRRARKHSPLCAVVVQFNRRRKREERRGILVTADAIRQAELECLADQDKRATQRTRSAQRRKVADQTLVQEMSRQILAQFPYCPGPDAHRIAAHTAERGSGRVGRSAAGRELDTNAIRLAVVAHVRHEHTPYDELLMSGVARATARTRISRQISTKLAEWEKGA